MLVNGYPLADGELDSDTIEDAVLSKIMNLTPDIQIAIYMVTIFAFHAQFILIIKFEANF